jgi:hypothetical protein
MKRVKGEGAVKTERVVSLCCYCDRIQDEKDYWLFLPGFLARNPDVEYQYEICPDCYERFGVFEIEELHGK